MHHKGLHHTDLQLIHRAALNVTHHEILTDPDVLLTRAIEVMSHTDITDLVQAVHLHISRTGAGATAEMIVATHTDIFTHMTEIHTVGPTTAVVKDALTRTGESPNGALQNVTIHKTAQRETPISPGIESPKKEPSKSRTVMLRSKG